MPKRRARTANAGVQLPPVDPVASALRRVLRVEIMRARRRAQRLANSLACSNPSARGEQTLAQRAAARAAANAASQQRARGDETPAHADARRAADAASQQRARGDETPAQSDARRAADAASQQRARGEETPAQADARRAAVAASQQRARGEETPAQADARRAADAAKHRETQEARSQSYLHGYERDPHLALQLWYTNTGSDDSLNGYVLSAADRLARGEVFVTGPDSDGDEDMAAAPVDGVGDALDALAALLSDPEHKSKLANDYYKVMGHDLPLLACASCGVSDYVSQEDQRSTSIAFAILPVADLDVLQLSEPQLAKYLAVPMPLCTATACRNVPRQKLLHTDNNSYKVVFLTNNLAFKTFLLNFLFSCA
jgi:hypothetical protein